MRKTSPKGRGAKDAWILASIAYGVLRVVLAGTLLSDYGLNVAVFAVVEITSSAVFGIASGRLVESLLHRQRRNRALLVLATLAGYSAPDVYMLGFADEYPANVRNSVIAIIAMSAIVSFVALLRRLRQGGSPRTQASPSMNARSSAASS